MTDMLLRRPWVLIWSPLHRLQLHPLSYAFGMALLTTLLFHQPLFALVSARVPLQGQLPYVIWTLVLLLNCLLFLLCSLPRLQRPLLHLLFLTAASSHYFTSQYGTVIDKSMMQNLLETDLREATALLNSNMVFTLGGYGLFLAVLQLRTTITWRPYRRYFSQLALALLLVITALGGMAASQYSSLAPFFRNHRDVKFFAFPISPVSSAISLTKHQLEKYQPVEFQQLGTDIVNLQLSQRDLVSFTAVSSCGTATAHSVPCMFSAMSRDNYHEKTAYNSSNILDILAGSGIDVSWFDNNSGCKGVCDRLPSTLLYQQEACKTGQCSDQKLLELLVQQLATPTPTRDRLIVLHQLGSHGPEYFKRSQLAEKQFLPECTQKDLSQCTRQEVVNAYDNSLLATDALLAGIIDRLQTVPHSAMLYISDHGESLGENGVYLHGLPYWMAPAAQTQVPLIWWMAEDFARQQRLSLPCLQQQANSKLSHDHLFHSLGSLFARQSAIFQAELNLFNACQATTEGGDDAK